MRAVVCTSISFTQLALVFSADRCAGSSGSKAGSKAVMGYVYIGVCIGCEGVREVSFTALLPALLPEGVRGVRDPAPQEVKLVVKQ